MNDISILKYLRCPICSTGLVREGKSLICHNNHNYDISKSGYVNLLPPGKGGNSNTGDEKLMIKARADFLSRGYYSGISRKVAELINQNSKSEYYSICDLGSGEGCHTVNISKSLNEINGKSVISVGLDASKYGAESASKLSRSCGYMPHEGIGAEINNAVQSYFVPANIFHLPLEDNCFDVAVSMFAPVPWEEADRVLKDDGILIVVSSGIDHLYEMRQVIYDNVIDNEYSPSIDKGFEKSSVHSLKYTVSLSNKEDIKNLFSMTPFYYKTTREGRDRLYSLDSLDVTVSVNYSIFKKI